MAAMGAVILVLLAAMGNVDGLDASYKYRARAYDPTLGRFLQRDPIGIWGDGINFGNGYAYVGEDPGNLVDPAGVKSSIDGIKPLGRNLGFNNDGSPRWCKGCTDNYGEAVYKHSMNCCCSVEKRTMSVTFSRDDEGVGKRALEAMKANSCENNGPDMVGDIHEVGKLADIVNAVKSVNKPCECIKRMIINSHGNGMKLFGSATDADEVVGFGDDKVTRFANLIKNKFCKPCTIVLAVCGAGYDQSMAAKFAALTGCKVWATKGYCGLGVDKKGKGYWRVDRSGWDSYTPTGKKPGNDKLAGTTYGHSDEVFGGQLPGD